MRGLRIWRAVYIVSSVRGTYEIACQNLYFSGNCFSFTLQPWPNDGQLSCVMTVILLFRIFNKRTKRVKGIYHWRVQLWARKFRAVSSWGSSWKGEAGERRWLGEKKSRNNCRQYLMTFESLVQINLRPREFLHLVSLRHPTVLMTNSPHSLSSFNHISVVCSHNGIYINIFSFPSTNAQIK